MASKQLDFKLNFSAKKTGVVLLIITLSLMALHLIGQSIIWSGVNLNPFLWELAMRFNMDLEVSVPTWYNQILLLIAAAVAALIAVFKISKKGEYRYYWAGVAGLLAYMSLDEGSGMHEILGLLDVPKNIGIDGPLFVFGWVFIGMFLVATIATIFFKFWLSLPRQTKLLILLAAAVFVSGAIGVEIIGGYYSSIYGMDFIYNGPLVALEETLEHIGVIITIYALMQYASRYSASVVVGVTK